MTSFSYIFTHFPPQVDIHTEIVNIKKTAIDENPNECEDESLISLFVDILEKTENGAKSLDPLKDKPIDLLRKLIGSASIYSPKDVFNFSLADNSRAAVNDQAAANKLSIFTAIKIGEYELARHKLDDLKFLKDLLKEDSLETIFKECLKYVDESIREEFSKEIESFNNIFDNQNKLNTKDVEQYKSIIEKFKGLESFAAFGISNTLSDAMQNNLQTKAKACCDRVQNCDLCKKYEDVKTILENLKLISETFKEVLPHYQIACTSIQERILKEDENMRQHLILYDFSKVVEKLTSFTRLSSTFQCHLDYSKLTEMYKTSVIYVSSQIENIPASVEYCFAKEKLDEHDIKNLEEKLKIIEDTRDTLQLRDHIEKSFINEVYETYIDKIVSLLKGMDKKIENLFENKPENFLNAVELLVEEMENLRKIREIQVRTSEIFQTRIQFIISFIREQKTTAENLLATFYNQQENVEYNRLYQCMSMLACAKWINKHRDGVYTNIMTNINQDLINHSSKLYDSVLDSNINMANHANVEKVRITLKKLENMKPFERNIKELSEYRENAQNKFEEALNRAFEFIRDNFNLEKYSVKEHVKQLTNLEGIRNEFDNLASSRIYLKEKGYNSPSQLNDEIEKANQKVKQEETQQQTGLG